MTMDHKRNYHKNGRDKIYNVSQSQKQRIVVMILLQDF